MGLRTVILTLLLALGLASTAGAATPSASVTANPTTGALLAPTAATFRSANALTQQVTYVADGDSRTAGISGIGGGVNWFDLLTGNHLAAIAKNYGVPSKTVAQMVAGYSATGAASSTVSGGHQFSPTVTGGKGIYFSQGGTNDIGQGASAAATLANLQSLYAAARADGYSIIVGFTEFGHQIGVYGYTSDMETQRQALNTSIRALTLGQSNTPDILIDADRFFPNASTLADGVHLTAAQHASLASYVRAALEGNAVGARPYPLVSLRWTGSQAFSANGTVMTGFAVNQDNQGLYQSSAHQILCPLDGWVQVSACFQRINIGAIGDVWSLDLWSTPAGGSAAFKRTVTRQYDTSTSYGQGVNVSEFLPVTAGDLIDFRMGIGVGTNGWGISNNDGLSEFTLRYVPVQ